MNETPVSYLIMLATALVSFRAFSLPRMISQYGLSPWQVLRAGRWYQMFTSGFLHANFQHLLFNMITLYFFGPYLEMMIGSPGFTLIYFGSLFGGSLLTFMAHRDDQHYLAIGASGAVSGVLFAFILFRPTAMLQVFFIIPMPAVLFAILYVVGSIYGMQRQLGRIGHEAHLGGAITGLALAFLWKTSAF